MTWLKSSESLKKLMKIPTMKKSKYDISVLLIICWEGNGFFYMKKSWASRFERKNTRKHEDYLKKYLDSW